MRISDWSSDVCSSDLAEVEEYDGGAAHVRPLSPRSRAARVATCSGGVCGTMPWPRLKMNGPSASEAVIRPMPSSSAAPPATSSQGSRLPWTVDRKSAVWGKSVSVRVDLGGRRILNHKTQPYL